MKCDIPKGEVTLGAQARSHHHKAAMFRNQGVAILVSAAGIVSRGIIKGA